MQGEIVSQFGGEDDGRSLGWQHELGLAGAKIIGGSDRMQRLGLGRAERRQGYHHDGLGIAEGRRGVQLEVERIARRQRQGGNVLEMRSMERGEDPGGVNNGAEVGAVRPPSGHARVADLVHQVCGAAARELRHHGLRVGVVEHQTGGGFRKA